MWIPLAWILQHWVCLFHGMTPDHRFVVIPAIIVMIYSTTIFVFATRRLPEPELSRGDEAAFGEDCEHRSFLADH
jgi:hypothetical protein